MDMDFILLKFKIEVGLCQMKKSLHTLLIALTLIVSISSCKESTDKRKNDLLKKYQKMREVNDITSACFYLQEYIFIDSTKIEYYDSLARHFVMLDNVLAAESMAQKVVEKQPLNEDMQILLAQIDFQRGDLLTGMSRFDKLFDATKNYKFIFNKGLVYAQTGQANKTLEVVDQLLAVPDNEIKTITVKKVSDPNADQEVKIKAAAFFLKAYAYLGGQNPDRKAAYPFLEQSIALQGDFEMAQAIAQEAYPQGNK